MIALDRENVLAAVDALISLGYRPRPPVSAHEFADPAIRASWLRETDMTVFSVWSSTFPGTDVDIFAEEPMPFDDLRARAQVAELYGISVPIAAISDLIAMKRAAGRPEDLQDVAALERIARSLKRDGPSE